MALLDGASIKVMNPMSSLLLCNGVEIFVFGEFLGLLKKKVMDYLKIYLKLREGLNDQRFNQVRHEDCGQVFYGFYLCRDVSSK